MCCIPYHSSINSQVCITVLYGYTYYETPCSSHPLCIYSLVCIRPIRKPRRPVFSQRGSFSSALELHVCFFFTSFVFNHAELSVSLIFSKYEIVCKHSDSRFVQQCHEESYMHILQYCTIISSNVTTSGLFKKYTSLQLKLFAYVYH